MLRQPCSEFVIFAEDAIQSFSHNVGWRGIQKLGVALQFEFELHRNAELQGFILGLLRWCFQDGQEWFPFVNASFVGGCITKWLSLVLQHGQGEARRMRDEGGSDPKCIRTAESRTDGVAPARSGSLGLVLVCSFG